VGTKIAITFVAESAHHDRRTTPECSYATQISLLTKPSNAVERGLTHLLIPGTIIAEFGGCLEPPTYLSCGRSPASTFALRATADRRSVAVLRQWRRPRTGKRGSLSQYQTFWDTIPWEVRISYRARNIPLKIQGAQRLRCCWKERKDSVLVDGLITTSIIHPCSKLQTESVNASSIPSASPTDGSKRRRFCGRSFLQSRSDPGIYPLDR
jgi:hypothetical protein